MIRLLAMMCNASIGTPLSDQQVELGRSRITHAIRVYGHLYVRRH
jgi:hypothetical protein